jgi:hypothetical protein
MPIAETQFSDPLGVLAQGIAELNTFVAKKKFNKRVFLLTSGIFTEEITQTGMENLTNTLSNHEIRLNIITFNSVLRD